MPGAQEKNRWILGNMHRDLLLLHIPGLVVLVLTAVFLPNKSLLFKIFAFLTMGILDIGHVYSTLWRTYFNFAEIKRRPVFYVAIPVMVVLLMTAIAQLPNGTQVLVALLLATRLWHNFRQSYGLNRWYQKRNATPRPWADHFLYLLCWLPVLSLQFRSYWTWTKIGNWPITSEHAYGAVLMIYSISMLSWFIYELKIWNKSRELNRVLAIGIPAAMYAASFMGADGYTISYSLAFSHGLTYFVLVHYALKKTDRKVVGSIRSSALVVLVPIVVGILVLKFGEFAKTTSLDFFKPFVIAGAAAFYCHVIFDGFLWTRNHSEAALVYS
jgi:hypothetical protein